MIIQFLTEQSNHASVFILACYKIPQIQEKHLLWFFLFCLRDTLMVYRERLQVLEMRYCTTALNNGTHITESIKFVGWLIIV
jgi:hypothetical protein